MKKLILLILISLMITGCNQKEYKIGFFSMDTYIEVKVYSKNDEIYLEDIKDIFKEYEELTSMFDLYDNNIYYLNEVLEEDKEVKIDSKLYDILIIAKEYYENTNGVFNPCMGNVTSIWKKYINKEKEGIPSSKELLESGSISCDDIILTNGTFVKKSDVKLDLGAIVKGYVTDIVSKYLEDNNIDKYLINAGGNVKVGNYYKNSGTYKIGLQSPINSSEIFKTLNINNLSVVTSGDYERYYIYQDKKYSHIIDPKTLYPIDNMKSISILSKSSLEGDFYSTYLSLLTYEEGLEIVNNNDIDAIWFLNNNEVKLSNGVSKYE